MSTIPTLVDCTLRDGGYYTNWTFDAVLVEEYLRVCEAAGLDVVELGYVALEGTDRGAYGRLPDPLDARLRRRLPPSTRLRYAAMIDAPSLCRGHAPDIGSEIRTRLEPGCLPIDVIRVAVQCADVSHILPAVESLRRAGFGVCLNLMQVDLATPAQLDDCLAVVAGCGPLEAVYVADSLGSMLPERTVALVGRFAETLPHAIGFHAHDNQGLALANSLRAVEAGARWIDSSMGGMGRGAGNLKTEELLAVAGRGRGIADLDPVHAFVARRIYPLRETHRWGANVFYAIAGQRGIHPTYVQELAAHDGIGPDATMRTLRRLRMVASFSPERLREALSRD